MELLNFSDTQKQAFSKGFWKGMAAPVMLFGSFEAPKRRQVKPVIIQIKSVQDSLAGDWQKIGLDFRNVVVAHGKQKERHPK